MWLSSGRRAPAIWRQAGEEYVAATVAPRDNHRAVAGRGRRITVAAVSAGGGSTSLTVADLQHAQTLDAAVLTTDSTLAVADMLHAHPLDGVTVTLGGASLAVADLLHSHAMDGTALTLDTYLTVADALHGNTLDSVALALPEGTLDLILKILRNRQELNPSTGKFTLYDDDGTTVLAQSNAWADVGGTQPYSGGTLARIDALI